jgi:YY1-associated factor 2
MDHRKNSQRRQKRQSKALEENFWDCSVCTFRNTAEAFKCSMCDVRKGTSTRKPRLNPQLVAQQVAQQFSTATNPKPRIEGSKERKHHQSSPSDIPEEKYPKKKVRNIRPRLKNVDRSQVHRQPVTVNNVTVVITEFLPKSVASSSQSNPTTSLDIPGSPDVSISNHSEVSLNGDLLTAKQTS